MATKKINIFVVPGDTKGVRQFRIPRFLPVFLALLLIVLLPVLFWILRDYQTTRARMLQLAQIEKEYEQQKDQFIYLAQRIDQITLKLGELKEFDHKLKTMVNLETSENDTQNQGVGGSAPVLLEPKHTMADTHKELVRSMYRSLDNLDSEIADGKEDKAELHKFLENQKMLLASTPSIWPTKGWLSSRFGYRISPFTGEKEFHRGVDIATRMSTPIVAAADGIILYVGWDGGYGKVLTIKHGYGLVTKYAHLKKALVKKGQYVKRGETVALVGNTGRSTGTHLHYEVHLNRVPVNPLRYILN